MKKISRKNFSGLSHLASKAGLGGGSSSSATAAAAAAAQPNSGGGSHSNGSTPPNSGGSGIPKRPTWADKVREKLPELGENEYEVLWERGVLGVIFLESEKDGIPYVSKATESCISPLVHAGDVLKFVNVVRSQDHSFSEFFKILATMKKPVLLRFERPASSTTSSDGEDSPLDQRASSALGMMGGSGGGGGGRNGFPDAPNSNGSGAKVLRSNSVPQGESSTQPKPGRSAFWRTVSAKDPPSVNSSANSDFPSPHVKLQPPSPYTRGGSSNANGRVEQQQSHHGHVDARQFEVSPRDVYTEYAQQQQPEFYEYEVYWETGSLGLFFGEDRVTNRPVVTRSTTSANPVVQRMVAVNDTLVSANNVQSRDYSFEAFFARLQQMNKPVRLVFTRKVDASPAPSYAAGAVRDRKASVTVDSLASPGALDARHRSPLENGSHGRRVATPPPHQLTIVEEQESLAEDTRAGAESGGARTPPDSPVHARESVRESRRDNPVSRSSSRNFKPELDIDTSFSPAPSPVFSRESPSSTFSSSAPVAMKAPSAGVPEPSPLRRHRPSPLNLVRDTAAIMSSGHPDPKKSPSPLAREAPTESIASNSSEAQATRRVPPLAPSPFHNGSRQQATTPSQLSQSYSQVKRSPAPSPHGVSRESAPAMVINPELPPKRSPAPSPVVGSRQAAVGNSATLMESAQASASGGAATAAATAVSPTPSPTRSEVQSLSDFDTETKAETAVSTSVSSPEKVPSGGAATTTAGARSSSGEGRSLWEVSEDDVAVAAVEASESASASDEVIAASAVYSNEPSDQPSPEDIVHAAAVVPAAVVAAAAVVASEPEEAVALGVEMGLVADYELGIAVDVSVPEAKPIEVTEAPAVVAFRGEPVDAVEEDLVSGIEDQLPHSRSARGEDHADQEDEDDDEREPFMKSELERETESANGKNDLLDEDSDAMMDAIDQDITADIDGNDMMPQVSKIRSSSSSSSSSSTSSPFKTNKATVHANLAKYKRKAKNSRPVTKLPALTEEEALTVPLVAPNAVNTTVQVRGRSKPKPSMLETPDSKTYLVKWKETRSIGLQLKEVRFAKGVFPLVTDVCQEPCCELLKHVCVGDVIVEINGRNTSLMGVKKTVNFLKTCTKTTLLKLRHGPAFVPQRVSAYV